MSAPPVATTRMTFDDEFNTFSNSPDGSSGTWMTSYPYGGEAARTLSPNNEAEYYSDPSVGENPFSITNGVLNINATPAASGSNPYNLPYDSGVITTDKSFSQTYGYFEINAQLPAGQGLWPAFWMLPASNNYTSELDIFEVVNNSSVVNSTTHGSTNGQWGSNFQSFNTADTSAGFHTYGVDWGPVTCTYYMDGQAIGSAATPSSMNDPMFMLINLAVGGNGSWPGSPPASTHFPADMKIDYVRAYATANTTYVGGSAALTGNPVTPPVVPPVTTPPQTVTLGSGADTLALKLSEDAYQGDAQFTISIDGKQIGGTQTTTASHAAGATQEFDVKGAFGPGAHSVSVNFLNDLYAGSASTDRNLYLSNASVDSAAVPGASLALMSSGAQSIAFQGPKAPPVVVPPVVVPPAVTILGSGDDTLALKLSEDAYQGDAQFTISVDGKQIGGTQTATASHGAGGMQEFDAKGTFAPGAHSMSVNFLNDKYDGTPQTDRNLYVSGATMDGKAVPSSNLALMSGGPQSFAFQGPVATTPPPTGLVLHLAEDAYQGNAQFTVAIDGKQLGLAQAVTTLNSTGGSQAFNFNDLLPAGTHDLAVSFTNDLYGGTSSTDRNLYVTGASFAGHAIAGANTAIYGNDTQHYAFTV